MSPEFEKLHRLLGDAKCSLLLDKSRKRIKHTVSKDTIDMYKLDVDNFVKNEMVQKLSREVVNNVYSQIKKEDEPFGNSYELDVVVIPTSDLKSVVDYLVQNMSLEDLLKIRSYGKEDKPFNL
jgi:hypothetical protein